MKCQGCEKRVIGCHSWCDDYIAFDRERKAYNEFKNKHVNSSRWTSGHLGNCKNKLGRDINGRG